MKKTFLVAFATIIAVEFANAQASLTKLWSSDTALKVPESVFFSKSGKVLFVANIDGQPGEKDGNGSIGQVALDGKIIQAEWVKGLNAPKGMTVTGGSLWVADVDRVAEIDIRSGTIKSTVPVEGAEFLNDVTSSPNGTVYVSDSKTGKVYELKNGKPSLYLEGLKGPNGLLCHDGALYVLDNGTLLKVSKDKKQEKIAEGLEGGTDGIEPVKGNDFIVSCWSGVIYYVHSDGKTEKLLDTREQKINSADIGYDPIQQIVYVPTFWKNNVVAYKLSVK